MMDLYRIKHIPTGRHLVCGSEKPNRPMPYDTWGPDVWYARGMWSRDGSFFKKTTTIRKHLHRLCHDWKIYRYGEKYWQYGYETITDSADWSRLGDLCVEHIAVTEHSSVEIKAAEFLGLTEKSNHGECC